MKCGDIQTLVSDHLTFKMTVPASAIRLSLRLGLKAKIFGLGLGVRGLSCGLGTQCFGLGLISSCLVTRS